MKILFMGTPDFAAGILESIIESRHEVICAVTQEDKPKGRSDKPIASAVKECALSHGIPVFQPHRIKDAKAVEELRKYDADIFVVAAYGQILSKEILDMPKYGCINTHASLLPKYRGAAPIQWAIVDGEEKTGVTVMQMDEGLDTGDILYVKEVDITCEETGESLFNKLEICGKELIIEALDRIEKGDINPIKQNSAEATYARILNKQMGEIDWNKTAVEIERQIRGFTPWPGTFTYFNGKLLKILKADVAGPEEIAAQKETGRNASDKGTAELSGINIFKERPGIAACVSGDVVYAATGKDYLKITRVQLEGKKKMDVRDFLLGFKLNPGDRLGK
ncbi:MAG: methionyl-tRNA formyltransferase [Lachnospiraceae bacterium]|nr:methionyl-tRNA formyltransferase [Lachnospiraceae bacterium]